MATSLSVLSLAARTLLASVFLLFYGEALLAALPFVVMSLPLFDPVLASLGPAMLVSLLGGTLWFGWNALTAAAGRGVEVAAPAVRFLCIWTVYNAVGAAVIVSL